jgi:lipopolysaccharide export LptBFGC system permease protein LptF
MTNVCSACNYTRQLTDYAPDWECPKCQKAYAKTTQLQTQPESAKITDPLDQQIIELTCTGTEHLNCDKLAQKQNLFYDQHQKEPGLKSDYVKDIFHCFVISFAMYLFLRLATRYADVTVGILIILVGVFIFFYRHSIGSATDYYVGHGRWVDKPTPGWMLIPFALVLIAIGVLGIFVAFTSVKSTYTPQHRLPQYRVIPDDLMR